MDVINFISSNENLFLALVAGLSLLVGSFLNVVIYRLPLMLQNEWGEECREYLGLKPNPEEEKKLSLHLPLSHCTACKKKLKPWHNIPVISYLVLRGKCAYCSTAISIRYPFVELLCAAASVYVAWRFGFSIQTFAGLIFTWIIIAATFIDMDHQLLPDELTLSLLWVGLFFSMFGVFGDSRSAIIGAIAGYLIFYFIQATFYLFTKKEGMGQGDFKFLAAFGAYLGWQEIPLIILLASFTGLFFGIAHIILKKRLKSEPMPFGPYLAIAAWIALVWGGDLTELYLESMFVV